MRGDPFSKGFSSIDNRRFLYRHCTYDSLLASQLRKSVVYYLLGEADNAQELYSVA